MRSFCDFRPNSWTRLLWVHLLWAGPLCMTALLGCAETTESAVVRGTVTFRGKQLDHGSLRFFGADGRPISCVIQQDGSYEISLPAGNFQVGVSSPPLRPANSDPKDDTPPPPDRNALPERYSQIASSGLKLSVSLQVEPRVWDITLK